MATWTEQTGAGIRLWYSIASSSDGTKLVAAVFNGYIYTSTDSGVNWTERTGAGLRNWVSVASSSDGTKLVAAVSGYIYTSTDSGATWTEQTGAGLRNWVSVASSSDGTKLVAAVTGGYIYTSTDSGVNWTERTGAGSRNWYSVASSSDGTKLVAAANGGFIYTSTDSGVNWTARIGAGIRNWYSVASSSDGTKLVAGVSGAEIYVSVDSGASWTAQTGAGGAAWHSVASSSDGMKLVAVIFGGDIYTGVGIVLPPNTPTGLTATCVKPIAPEAKFSADKISGPAPLTVQFSNQTTGTAPITYVWEFGDGSTSTSAAPSHTYTTSGTYQVRMTATNSLGFSVYNSVILVSGADIVLPPTAIATASSQVTTIGTSISFSTGTADAYSWNFGDGNTSTSQNPTHSYAANGTYTVTLATTKDGIWTSITTLTIVVTSDLIAIPPVATSLGASNTSGSIGLAVTFTPTFTGGAATSYSWEFGDGYTSILQSPAHTYTQSGIFTAKLTITNQYGSTTSTVQISIVELSDQQDMPEGVSTLINGKKIGYFIVDSGSNRILVYEKTGGFIISFGSFGNGNGQFNVPTRLCVVGANQGLDKIEV